jgi:hypothetical protein
VQVFCNRGPRNSTASGPLNPTGGAGSRVRRVLSRVRNIHYRRSIAAHGWIGSNYTISAVSSLSTTNGTFNRSNIWNSRLFVQCLFPYWRLPRKWVHVNRKKYTMGGFTDCTLRLVTVIKLQKMWRAGRTEGWNTGETTHLRDLCVAWSWR